MDKTITGQLIFRDKGQCPDHSGRKLFMVVGLLAVPVNLTIESEHQYTILGTVPTNLEIYMPLLAHLNLLGPAIDRSTVTLGGGSDDMLRQAIWRF